MSWLFRHQPWRDRHANDLGPHVQAFNPGSGIVADPEGASDAHQRHGWNLIVELRRHGRDEDAAKAKQGFDIHGIPNPFDKL